MNIITQNDKTLDTNLELLTKRKALAQDLRLNSRYEKEAERKRMEALDAFYAR